jgi:hypothetical protein
VSAFTPRRSGRRTSPASIDRLIAEGDASLLDVVDNVLNKGVVLTGDLTIGLAHVDLIYARLSLLLCAADRILPADPKTPPRRSSPRMPAHTRRRA